MNLPPVVCRLPFVLLLLLLTTASRSFAADPLYDLSSIRDTESLELKVIQDWRPSPKHPTVQEKLIEITVCQWWPGQKVRLPVTLLAPADGLPCRNVVVTNQGLAVTMGRPTATHLKLIQDDGVGVVLIGMGTIDAMQPKGELHHAMRQKLLETKDVRYTPVWIWGASQMRALTAAMTEPKFFQPEKVLATGGSKRGVASAVAGIVDDRFTAIVPIVAPMLGNPGSATFVNGNEPRELVEIDKQFYADLAAGKLTIDPAAEKPLRERAVRRATQRISLQQAIDAGWTESDIDTITDRVWDISRITNHMSLVKERGLDVFYNVGTNDSVSPSLLELGNQYPDFPVCIIAGGQHGGPTGAGFDRQVPKLPEIDQNFYSFTRHHFFGHRSFPSPPKIDGQWDPKTQTLSVTVSMADDRKPQQNEVWWCIDRSKPHTLPFEYDRWESATLDQVVGGGYRASIPFQGTPKRIDFLSLHVDAENDLPIKFSSPYQRVLPQTSGK